MKIEVWSDFSCPFCYMGKELLQTAIQELPFQDEIDVRLKSYELDPAAEKHEPNPINESLADKYNISIAEAKAMNEEIEKQAEDIGLQLNIDRIQRTNTFDAHRLIKYAEKRCKETELEQVFFKAYFTNGINLSDHESLAILAGKVGFQKEDIKDFLQSCRYTKRVREDTDLAVEMGVRSVPFFVFNETYALSGAQPVTVFIEVMTKVWEEETEKQKKRFRSENKRATYCCDDDGCYSLDE